MAIDPRISLAIQGPSLTPGSQVINTFQNALTQGQNRRINEQQAQQQALMAPLQRQAVEQNIAQQAIANPLNNQLQQQQVAAGDLAGEKAIENRTMLLLSEAGNSIKPVLESRNKEQSLTMFNSLRESLAAKGLPTAGTDKVIQMIEANDFDGAINLVDAVQKSARDRGLLGVSQVSVSQREHQSLLDTLQDPNASQVEKNAAGVKLGIKPRAVGSSAQTVALDEDLTQKVADSKAKIRQAEKFGELTATSRAKAIDKGFDQITKIDLGLSNIDDAIQAVNDGAGTGFIDKNFPSIKAASVLLDNIQGRMALDVIGAVTFGALSKGELDLAKMIALPTGLEGPELIKHLQDKKSAQQKLRNYYGEQIEFLDQGGSVAGFLRSKKREASSATPEPQPQPDQTQVSEGQTATGPNGEKAIFTNGQWVVQ